MYNFWLSLNCGVFNYKWHLVSLMCTCIHSMAIAVMSTLQTLQGLQFHTLQVSIAIQTALRSRALWYWIHQPIKKATTCFQQLWSIFKNQTIATNVNVGRWSEKSQDPGRKLHPTKIMYLFLNFFLTSNQYTFPWLWTISQQTYAAAKVFEEMPTSSILE